MFGLMLKGARKTTGACPPTTVSRMAQGTASGPNRSRFASFQAYGPPGQVRDPRCRTLMMKFGADKDVELADFDLFA